MDQDLLRKTHPIKKMKLIEACSGEAIDIDAKDNYQKVLAYMVRESDLSDCVRKLNSKINIIHSKNKVIENSVDGVKLDNTPFSLALLADQNYMKHIRENFEPKQKTYEQTVQNMPISLIAQGAAAEGGQPQSCPSCWHVL